MKSSSRRKTRSTGGPATGPAQGSRPAKGGAEIRQHSAQWTFLTNHAHVLILLARDPDRILREVAQEVGITERAVQRIIVDLEAAGIIVRERSGRQNHYRIDSSQPLRHPVESHRSVSDLIQLGSADEAESSLR